LLGRQGIEKPTIVTEQLWEHGRVAVFLAEGMGFLVFGFEVEYINGEADVGKVRIQLDMLSE
jgi:hypothetical protein